MQENAVTISDVLNDKSKDLKNVFDSNPISNNSDDYELNQDMGNCHYFYQALYQFYSFFLASTFSLW